MIKKLLLAIMLAIPVSMCAQKFAVIDTQAIMSEMPEVKTAQEQLMASQQKYEAEFTKLQEEFGKKFEEYNSLDENTPATIRERRTTEMQELEAKINQFRQTAAEDLQRQQQQLLAPIQENVMKAVQAVGQEGAYTFIFENMVPVYVGTDVTDITPTVKTRLGIK
ncbi:MAG: OmpH family outer membrane protein [Duncaniella sp.]|nr:OmpH family outer membrane protein [Duncaniella sp.]